MTATLISVLGWLVAALLVGWQLWETLRAQRVQRTIDLHEVLTTGEVGAARDRFATYMWTVGDRHDPGKCYRPSFVELLGSDFARGREPRGGLEDLGVYPDELGFEANTRPLQDLFRLLWAFERISAAARRRLTDPKIASQLLDQHAVWWDTLTSRIQETEILSRGRLAELAVVARSRNPSIQEWADDDFVA